MRHLKIGGKRKQFFTAGFIYSYIYMYIYTRIYIYIYIYTRISSAVTLLVITSGIALLYVEVEVLWYYNIFLVPSTWVKIYSNYVIGFVEKNV